MLNISIIIISMTKTPESTWIFSLFWSDDQNPSTCTGIGYCSFIFQFLKHSSEPTTLLVDFKSVIRRVPLKNVSKIIGAFDLGWNTINTVCSHNTLNIMYDSYIENSLKPCKGDRWREKCPLEIMNIKLCGNVLKTMFHVLSFANTNLFQSRNFTPYTIHAFSHSFLLRIFSTNGQFPQIY